MTKKSRIILAILAVAIVGACFGIVSTQSFLRTIRSNMDQLVNTEISNVDLSNIADGAYTGSYKVFPITVEVKVTVKNHAIEGIELVKHRSGQGAPAEAIIGKVVKSQSLQVNAISGATYSSKVILKAIENALIQAGGTLKDTAARAVVHCDCE